MEIFNPITQNQLRHAHAMSARTNNQPHASRSESQLVEPGQPSPASEQTVCTRTGLPFHKPDCCCCVARLLPSNGIPSSSSIPRGLKLPHQKLAVSLIRNSTHPFCLDSMCQRVYAVLKSSNISDSHSFNLLSDPMQSFL
jgi:hypothetical protein